MLANWMIYVAAAFVAGDSKVELVAGGSAATALADGVSALEARIEQPFGCEFGAGNSLWFVEFTTHRLRVIDFSEKVTTKAGTGRKGWTGDGESGSVAAFNGIHNLAIGADNVIYLSDTFNNRVRKFDPATGKVSTLAGTGRRGYSGDGGPAYAADLAEPHCVAFDPAKKKLFIADLANRRVRAIDMATGVIDHVSGSGFKGVPMDGGNAKRQPLVDPRAVAVDAAGRIYVVERSGNAIRRVDPDGKVFTVAGAGRKGTNVADGPALQATLNGPKHACVDAKGDLLIADTENHAIRKLIVASGQLVRVAGTGTKGDAGVGGAPLDLQLKQPHGVTVHKDGSIYIADSGNGRILRIKP